MIIIPDYPWLVKRSDDLANFKKVFALLIDVVRSSLQAGAQMYTRKNVGFIAWERWTSRYKSSGRDVGRWNLYFFRLTNYNAFTFRLRGDAQVECDLTARFWPPVGAARGVLGAYTTQAAALRDHYRFELSFCAEDIHLVATPDLVRFVESTFEPPHTPESIWRWPLFAHYPSFPHYAWTKAGWQKLLFQTLTFQTFHRLW